MIRLDANLLICLRMILFDRSVFHCKSEDDKFGSKLWTVLGTWKSVNLNFFYLCERFFFSFTLNFETFHEVLGWNEATKSDFGRTSSRRVQIQQKTATCHDSCSNLHETRTTQQCTVVLLIKIHILVYRRRILDSLNDFK